MRTLRSDEGGQAIVLIGIVLLALIMAVGLAMDTGQLYNGRRTAQEAADAGAFAGAVVLYQSGTAQNATDAALKDAYLNGYCQASVLYSGGGQVCASDMPTSGTTVTVSSPPSTGAYAANSSCVQVAVSVPVKTTLVPQSEAFTTVKTTSAACSVAATNPYAMIATQQTCGSHDTIPALNVSGTLDINGGSVQVNACTPSTGYDASSSSGTVTLDTGFGTDVVGNASGTWPSLNTGKSVQADPFAGTARPSTNGMTVYGTANCSPTVNQPGVYTSDAQGNCLYIFAPGTYVFKGAGLQLSGSSSGACTGRAVSTTVTATIASGGVTATVTPASMSNISVGKMLVVDTGTSQEGVVPSAVTATSFTAIFAKAHSGTFSVTGGCSGGTDTADGGAFFFFTNSNYSATGGSCGNPAIKIEGGVATTLTAPTSGTYQGMLFWQDSTCTVDISIGGGGALYTSGSIYAPNAAVTGNGNGATVEVSQIIAKTVNTGQAKFTMNYNAALNYAGKVPALVE